MHCDSSILQYDERDRFENEPRRVCLVSNLHRRAIEFINTISLKYGEDLDTFAMVRLARTKRIWNCLLVTYRAFRLMAKRPAGPYD